MARTRNEHYEYVERDGLFRKRVKDATGKYVAIYGETPEDVTKQLIDFYEQRDIDAEEMKDPLFSVYARRWLELNCGNLTKATQKGYLTILNNHIIPFLDDLRMNEIRPRDIKVVITRAGQMSESVHNKTYMLLKRILTTAYAQLPALPEIFDDVFAGVDGNRLLGVPNVHSGSFHRKIG